MKKNGVFDIFCKIISVLLSIVFVAAIIVTALFYSVTNVLKPETLTEIITDIDYGEILSGSVIEAVGEKQTTLSFRPVILMSGTFKNSNTGGKFTMTPEGDVGYEGQAGSDGENVTFSIIDGEYANAPDSAQSVIGGADEPESVVVAPSKSSGVTEDSFFGEITENFSEKEIEMIKSFMESDVAKEILDEYANTVNEVISGKDAKLDKEKIKKIIIENKEEIIAFIQQNMNGEVNEEEISNEIEKFINENVDTVLQVLPEPQEIVKELPAEVIEIVNIINSGIILRALFTVDAILALFIFILRLWDFAGFLWLGVDGIISGIILAFIYIAINVFKNVIFNIIPTGQAIIRSVFSAITSRMLMSVAVIIVASIILIIIFSIIKKLRKR